MFGIILTLIVTFMHVYVFWRAASVPFVKRHVPRKVLIAVGVVLWGGFVLGRFFGHGGTGVLSRTLELLGMNWMGVLFLTSVAMLATDVLTGFGFLFRRRVPSLRGLALVVGGVLSVIAVIQGTRAPVVESYDVYLPGLPDEMDGTVIVGISDLHLGSLLGERWLEARVAQVQAEHPDVVVLLGDIFEGHGAPQEQLLPILRRLSAPLGVWAVLGNHEYYHRHDRNPSLLNGAGFQVLRGAWVEVHPGLVVAGVDDLTAMRRSGRGGDSVLKALEGRPASATVLLSHTPWDMETAANAGVGLMLCGHTHGGQIWPFDYVIQRRYPLLEGRHEVDGMTLIICRGTGTWGPRMRLWCPGEILRVTLHSERKRELAEE
jgi:predicted MPP superfamily phosphohydrolase